MIQQMMVLSHVLTTCAQLQILQVNRQQQDTVKRIRMASVKKNGSNFGTNSP
jgi:hypothetical protein